MRGEADQPAAKRVRVGCSGWNYRDWRGRLYPDGLPARRWLERYAECFDTVEVNSTFYRLPKEAVARWVEQTPPDFLFAVKASRYLTHIKRLRDVGQGVRLLLEGIEPLAAAARLGPILWQLPPNFRRDDAEVLAYFNNDWEGLAVRNAVGLARRLERVCPPRRRATE